MSAINFSVSSNNKKKRSGITLWKNFQLGLLHVAIAITSVAINGVLNRIMINDLGILSTIVAILVVLPYLLSPTQVWIGQYSDTHPIFGYRRSPYIVLGMIFCFVGMVLTPNAALLLASNFWMGIAVGLVAFGLWGMGFNLAVVSYLSLASDLSEEDNRSQTIAMMWFMMIVSIIVSAILIGRALEPYSEAQLFRVFYMVAIVGMGMVVVGIVGLEKRHDNRETQSRHSQATAVKAVLDNPQARIFFIYLIMMLVAILGQDILLEPYGAFTFDMSVQETTQLTALWGSATLVALVVYGFVLNRFMSKRTGALLGAIIATVGLIFIGMSGLTVDENLFNIGIAVLGFGTGIATSTNLGLMLDMTTAEQVGLFIGAWGVADALARGLGMLLSGIVRDVITFAFGNPTLGYVSVFFIQAVFLVA
ncbi:MAG: BCD family MFS transporter, partial [Chloroflexota bacterium]